MPYTVWSNGVLLGHSDLGFVECLPKHRVGWFHATEQGEPIIEILNDPRRASLNRHNVDKATLEADLLASYDRLAGYPLELRDDAGAVIPTEDIAIMDMDITMQFAALSDPTEDIELPGDEFDMSEYGIIEEELDEDEGEDAAQEEWPRYQLMICFEGHEAAMMELAAQMSHDVT